MAKTDSRGKRAPHGMVYQDWMGDNDALMWHIERDPLLRSTVLGVWLLDRAPDQKRFAATLERTMRHVPRLAQRVVEDPLGVAPPRWEPDPLFEPSYHVRRVRAPGAGTLRDLLDMAAPVAMQSFDRDRPLWELHCVEGLEEGRFGVILKMHHAMTDGVGMVRMTERLVERSREDQRRTTPSSRSAGTRAKDSHDAAGRWAPEPAGEIAHLGDAMRHRLATALERARRAAAAFGRGVTHFAGHPISSAGEVVDTLESVAQLVRPVSEPMSPLWRRRSLGVRLDVLDIPFDAMKRAARAVDGTLNDVFVAAVAGGLSRHHRARRAPVDALRMSMPINIRSGDKGDVAGNQFVPARFAVAMNIRNPRERLSTLGALVRAQRDEPALGWIEEITAVINLLGDAAATRVVGSMMKAVDFVTSNVPGPPFPVYVSGARIERMFPFGPPAGAAVNITLFSYNGVAQIGVRSDPAAVPDPERLMADLQTGFDEVLGVA
jgi:diacylglycerol O-acyltransferase / wax synthase